MDVYVNYKSRMVKAMEYRNFAKEILKNVGGRENVISLTYCATRLRFNLKNEETAKSLSRDDKFMLIEELSGSLTGKWTEGEADTPFLDVKDHWAKEYVTKASALGLFKGMPDGSFDPLGNVTFAQAAAVTNRIMSNK